MKLFALIGHPLAHSFSKAYFTEKFEQEKIDACYELFDLERINQLPQIIERYPDLCGFNVTIPYKEAIIPYLDLLDPEAKAIGAVNTVKVLADSGMIGYNTDIVGIETTLTQAFTQPLSVRGTPKGTSVTPCGSYVVPLGHLATLTPALILGTGGASKAVQYVLSKHHLPYHLVSRNPQKGDFTYETLTPEVIKSHLLIINATPVGMAPHINEAPMIPYEAITPQHVLFDLTYNPEETLFLRHGREHGATTINGLTMLYAQAEASWSIWNKVRQGE